MDFNSSMVQLKADWGNGGLRLSSSFQFLYGTIKRK